MRSVSAFAVCIVLATAGCPVDDGSGSGGAEGSGRNPFVGWWSGTVSNESVRCDDGTLVAASTSPVAFELRPHDTGLTWEARCGEFFATVQGDTATQDRPVTCPATRDEHGVLLVDTVHDLTLALAPGGKSLALRYVTDIRAAGGLASAVCSVPSAGTLQREQ